jgi:hypothetical protein
MGMIHLLAELESAAFVIARSFDALSLVLQSANIFIDYKSGNAMHQLCDQFFSYLCITRKSRQNGVPQRHLSPRPGVTAAVGEEPK